MGGAASALLGGALGEVNQARARRGGTLGLFCLHIRLLLARWAWHQRAYSVPASSFFL